LGAIFVGLLPLDARIGESDIALASSRNLAGKNLLRTALRTTIDAVNPVHRFCRILWRKVAGPGQHDSLTGNARRKIPRRRKSTPQGNPHLIRQPSAAAIRIEHLECISNEIGGV